MRPHSALALFGNPVRDAGAPEPGRPLHFLPRAEGRRAQRVARAVRQARQRASAITTTRKRGIREHAWALDGRHILFLQDEGGDENWRVYSVDVESGKQLDLTPLQGRAGADRRRLAQAGRAWCSSALNDREPEWHDLYEIDVSTGERKLVEKNEQGFAGYLADLDLQPRIAVKTLPRAAARSIRRTEQGLGELPRATARKTASPRSRSSSKAMAGRALLVSAVGRDKAALVRVDLASGKQSRARRERQGGHVATSGSSRARTSRRRLPSNICTTRDHAAHAGCGQGHRAPARSARSAVRRREPHARRSQVDRRGGRSGERRCRAISTIATAAQVTKLFDQRPELANAPLQPMHRAGDQLARRAHARRVPHAAAGLGRKRQRRARRSRCRWC